MGHPTYNEQGELPRAWMPGAVLRLESLVGGGLGGVGGAAAAGVLAWGASHDALEGGAEGALRLVAEREGDGGDGLGGVGEAVGGEEHAPLGEVFHGGLADGLTEAGGEDGAGHAGAEGELVEGPAVGWALVDGVDGGAHLRVGEGGEPAGRGLGLGEVEAEGLDEEGVGDVLDEERAAGLRVCELLTHALEGGAEGGFVRVAAEMDDGREDAEEDFRVVGGEGEVGADGKAGSTAVEDADAALDGRVHVGLGVDGVDGKVGGEAEGRAAGEQEAVAGLEVDGLGNALDGKPAVAGEDGVALDAVVPFEADGEGMAYVKAAGHGGVRLEEGENVREWVHSCWASFLGEFWGGLGFWDDGEGY